LAQRGDVKRERGREGERGRDCRERRHGRRMSRNHARKRGRGTCKAKKTTFG